MITFEQAPFMAPFPPEYCTKCGAIVIDKEAHVRFHADIDLPGTD